MSHLPGTAITRKLTRSSVIPTECASCRSVQSGMPTALSVQNTRRTSRPSHRTFSHERSKRWVCSELCTIVLNVAVIYLRNLGGRWWLCYNASEDYDESETALLDGYGCALQACAAERDRDRNDWQHSYVTIVLRWALHRFRTEAHSDVVARFNERFILSLGSCKHCLAMDDELNILPITDSSHSIHPVSCLCITDFMQPCPSVTAALLVQVHVAQNEDGSMYETAKERELRSLKESLKDTQPVGALVATARTNDQVTFNMDASRNDVVNTYSLYCIRLRQFFRLSRPLARKHCEAPSHSPQHVDVESLLHWESASQLQWHMDIRTSSSLHLLLRI